MKGKCWCSIKAVDPVIIAKENTTLMLLGGEPLGERFIWWNFVSSRKERIEQAKEDWKQGRIILPPTDNKEFIPLPEDKSRPQVVRQNQNRFHDQLNHIFSKGISIRLIPAGCPFLFSGDIPASGRYKQNKPGRRTCRPSRSFVPNIREAGSARFPGREFTI